MKLVQTIQLEGKKIKSQKAVDRFKSCPLCGDSHLIRVSPEVVCSKCDWNSALWSVSRGRMDNLFGAAIEDERRRGEEDVVLDLRDTENLSPAFDKAMGEMP